VASVYVTVNAGNSLSRYPGIFVCTVLTRCRKASFLRHFLACYRFRLRFSVVLSERDTRSRKVMRVCACVHAYQTVCIFWYDRYV